MAKYVAVQVTRKEPPGSTLAEGERCEKCLAPFPASTREASLGVCPNCGYHYSVRAVERLAQLADAGTAVEVFDELRPADPLNFFDVRPYSERLTESQAQTGLSEALVSVTCAIQGREVALAVMDFRFMGGSMGSVVGERFCRLVQLAAQRRIPFVVVAASGGARMQEGLLSLMQMAKTVVVLQLLSDARQPFVSVLTHPTTGGVFASFATVADVIMAEPGAVMRFAGARVIEQTTREKLPANFGSSESQLRHGQIDLVVDRRELKARIAQCLLMLAGAGHSG